MGHGLLKNINNFFLRKSTVILGLLITINANAAEKHLSKTKIINFKAAHGPYEILIKPLSIFKEEVEKLTDGRVKVNLIIPRTPEESNRIAVNKTFNDVKSGAIQMSQLYTSYMANYEKDFLALEIPFILKNHPHAFEVVDGEIGRDLLARLEEKSPLKGLGFTYCGGYRFIGTQSVKITKIEDFKGLKINTDSRMSASALKELGSIIIPDINKENAMGFLAENKIDGYVTVYPRYFHWNEYKTAKISNELNFNTQFTVLAINKKFFNTLSDKDKKIVEFAAQKASAKERQLAIDVADEVSRKADEYGIEVVKMSADETQKMIKKLGAVDWAKKHNISSEIIEKIKNLSKEKLTYIKTK